MKPDDQRALWRALHDASTRLAEEQTERWHEIANAIAADNGSLNPNAWFVAACRRIAELEAQVVEARRILLKFNGCDGLTVGMSRFDEQVTDWLARTAPKEADHG